MPRREGDIVLTSEVTGGADRGFDPAYFDQLYELESGNFWFRARNALINWALRRYFPSAVSMLEVGCGTGYVLSGIGRENPGLTLTASEFYVEGLRRAAQRVRRAAFLQMDARRMPFTCEFDVVGAFDVLEHIDEDECVLTEMARAVKPGGGVLLTVPQHPWLWSGADAYAYHRRRYRRDELMSKLARAGLRPVRCTSFVTLLLPLMLLSRLKQRGLPEFDPKSEFAIPRWLNYGLERVLDAERGLIRAGVPLPAGGSLMVVAARS